MGSRCLLARRQPLPQDSLLLAQAGIVRVERQRLAEFLVGSRPVALFGQQQGEGLVQHGGVGRDRQAIAQHTLAGGGDTVSAINVFMIEDKVGYISTAGGAFLEFLEGKRLPAVDILESRAKD